MEEEKQYWLGFSVFPGIGPVRFGLLLKFFGSAKSAWGASEKMLQSVHFPQKLIEEFISFRKHFSFAHYQQQLHENHVSVLTLDDPRYPKLLKEISDPPFLLYVKAKKSDHPINMERTIAVVGTRQMTRYGKEVVERIVSDLVLSGCTIISGMAYGIDAAAHQSAIDNAGKTVAVLGCGVDIIAPASNQPIYKKLSEEGYGAVVSEMPLGLRPGKGLFPARNRIISGLSRGVLVVEGADDSGALITARYAGDQGRDVFAVPGPITSPTSRGPAQLLRSGAILVESASDILSALGLAKSLPNGNNRKDIHKGATKEEQLLLDLLTREPLSVDMLVRGSGLTASIVAATITVLEVRDMVKSIGENTYAINYR